MTTLYRIDAEANMARFYALSIQPTLFGEWALVREWGRIGKSPQQIINTYSDLAEATIASDRLMVGKRRRGYQ